MSIFGEQLREREKKDRKAVETGERMLAAAVGKTNTDDQEPDLFLPEEQRQIALIARYYSLPVPANVPPCRDLSELLDVMLHPSGAVKRRISLTGKWWKDADGPFLAVLSETGQARALFPGRMSGLYYPDPETGKKIQITEKNHTLFGETAWHIYRPIPEDVRTGKQFFHFVFSQLHPGDVAMYLLTSLIVTFLGMLSPFATQIAFARIIPSRQTALLISLLVMLIATVIGSWITATVRFSINLRFQNRLDTVTQNSVYARVMNLPVTFFADKTAGGLSQRIAALNQLPQCIGDILFIATNTVIAFASGLPILLLAPRLLLPAVSAVALVLVLLTVTVRQEKKLEQAKLLASEANGGAVYDIVSGVQRIRISGSEDRAYGKWLKGYARQAGVSHAMIFPLSVKEPLVNIIRLAGLLWAFQAAYSAHLTVPQLASFSAAYGMMFGSLLPVIRRSRTLSRLGPILKNGEELLAAVPENSADKTVITRLSGNIELSHLVFRYEPDGRAILDDLSLQIRPGEYVAIVGRSGCGKSTLVKLLLGFETPESGSIYYDRKDLRELDLQSLRRNIGTVLQDGQLFAGNIFSNITITAPWLSEEDAWDAAEKAGIAEDIRRMPMGMSTMLSEGGDGISGGQKQRLMIARAIAPRPGILIFDEATSALDNLTQKTVTESLDRLRCTRIVIAHRLSTIRDCDR
ncbi:MAG: ATP-binding cassette domain-containing protein, partial [bacterium]